MMTKRRMLRMSEKNSDVFTLNSTQQSILKKYFKENLLEKIYFILKIVSRCYVRASSCVQELNLNRLVYCERAAT